MDWNFRCHQTEGVSTVQMISVTTHTLSFKNKKVIHEFYEKFKGHCKHLRPAAKPKDLP